MHVGVIGINHKSSTLALREKLARAFQKAFAVTFSSDFVLLSTCNRTELYFSSSHLAECHIEILNRLRTELHESFEHALYSYFGRDCFYHLGRVISGMDSAIFGESDIQRQVKLAYEKQRQSHQLSHDLHYLFQKGLKIGKEMRTSVLVTKKGTQLAAIIQSIMERKERDLSRSSILFIGNSDVNRKLHSFFEWKGCREMVLCTRMAIDSLPSLAVVDWTGLKEWHRFDVVICGTYHEEYVLDAVEGEISPTLLFDLSVPRTIHPDLGKHPQISLYNIDQIGEIFQKKRGEKEIALCEDLIEKAVTRQMHLFKERREAKWKFANASAF
ncbi:MAG: Glutamyl-tRNA reductase [Chlamydiae bacterium]|nr:Glutamyl-tRNA reductase [Chlamydiota bacterium]